MPKTLNTLDYISIADSTGEKTKRKQFEIQLSKMYWLLGNKSQLSIENKLLLYKAILKPSGFMASNYGAQPPIQT